MEDLKKYLLNRLSEKTVAVYNRDIHNYLKAVPGAKHAGYAEVLNYIGTLRQCYTSGTVSRILHSVKAYYQWLMESKQRLDHPCKDLRLRDHKTKPIQLQDLFKPQELELLINRKERFPTVVIKNQIMMSLLVYQGLMPQELAGLKLKDLNLEEGTIYIKSNGHTNSRILKLKGKQIILLQRYLQEIRPRVVKNGVDFLILNLLGKPLKVLTIHNLIASYKHLFPDRLLNATTIRQSVITNLLKEGKDLRLVQAFAGHRNPSTTEKYKQTQVEELKEAVMKYHPLK